MRVLWKIMKVFGNIFGIILSIILCVALVVMLVATPMVSGFSAFTRPETITQIIHEIDFGQMIRDSISDDLSEDERKGVEVIAEMTESQAFYDLVELYATDLTNVFEEKEVPSVITEESLRQVVENNMDELVHLVRDASVKLGEDVSSYTDEELKEKVREAFDEMVERFIELAPAADDLRDVIARLVDEFTTNSSSDVPISDFEDEYDNWQASSGENDTVIITVLGTDGVVRDADGNVYYVTVDPETGKSYVQDENGSTVDSFTFVSPDVGTAVGGMEVVGKAVTANNGKISVLTMSVSPDGEQSENAQSEEIAHAILVLAGMAKDGTLTLIFVLVSVLLALLICLFRWPRFKGFMWSAIALLFATTVLVFLAAISQLLPGIISYFSGNDVGAVEGVVDNVIMPIIDVVTGNMYIAAGIYAGIAILLIVLFSIFRRLLEKQKLSKAAAAKKATVVLPGVDSVVIPVPTVSFENAGIPVPTANLEDVLAEIQSVPVEAHIVSDDEAEKKPE